METLHVLLVEDNQDDADLILRELKRANGYQILSERVDNEEHLKWSLHRQQWDIVICDYSMPRFDATRVLELLEGYGLDVPFILVSGKITEEQASAVLGRKSVHEYIPKDQLSKLAPIFYRALRLSSAYDRMLETFAVAVGLRDRETLGHSERVTEMSVALARVMGISETEIVHIRRGALVHDVGKLGIPDAILLKAGRLDDAEMYIMRKHPKIAYDLLLPNGFLRYALDIPYCHHEKWDGTGYPRGLKGEQIPLSARIFAVVDNYDAMTSDRPYRAGMPAAEVLAYISEASGTLLDPGVVDAFLGMPDMKAVTQ